jgi:hypothetical protein
LDMTVLLRTGLVSTVLCKGVFCGQETKYSNVERKPFKHDTTVSGLSVAGLQEVLDKFLDKDFRLCIKPHQCTDGCVTQLFILCSAT